MNLNPESYISNKWKMEIVWSLKNCLEDEEILQKLEDKYGCDNSGPPVELRLLWYVAEEWGIISYFKNIIEFPKIILSYVKYIYNTY